MVFKNFRISITIRTVLLGLFLFLSIYAASKYEWYVTTAISILISILLMIEIIRYSEKYKRSLGDFLTAINSRDYTTNTGSISDKETKDLLKNAYDTILTEFRNVRIDKEIQYHYLKMLVEHVQIAILSYDENENIEFINSKASKLLNLTTNQNLKKTEYVDKTLYNLIKSLKSGETELTKIKINNELYHLSVYKTQFNTQNKTIKLVSLQNIKYELEYQELESWQKLIRVLTHEIMNSVTPISSLSGAINETFEDHKGNIGEINSNDSNDIISSLKTIESRSKGLLRFVSSYKKLTRLPKPDFAIVDLVEIVNHSISLLSQKFKELNINIEFNKESNEHICFADYDQIEQVVINLLINAIDAIKEINKPNIIISLTNGSNNKQNLSIKDNGKGIDPNELEKIFIPFYTTKKEGSGIGLSLSRQILRLHKTNLNVNSELNVGTEFTINI